jgi:hypothetical protein
MEEREMNAEIRSFDFADSYRSLQPGAQRGLVAARQTVHTEMMGQIKHAGHVIDLCRLAFGLTVPSGSELASMLLAEVHKSDVQFSLTHDRAEAGRIAALLLSDRLARGMIRDAMAVLAASFAGLRESADENCLVDHARTCIVLSARVRSKAGQNPAVQYPKSADRTALIAALDQGINPQTVKPLFEAMIADDRAAGEGLAKAITSIVQSLFTENQRLAEEVDLLWWHIGNWSDCLARPMAHVPERGRGLIAGADLASMIRALPGPYGIAGLLRRSLGEGADQPMALREAVDALDPQDLKKAYPTCTDTDILPIHTAIQLRVDRGEGAWFESFTRTCGSGFDVPLSAYMIGLQAMWESSLVKSGWAK